MIIGFLKSADSRLPFSEYTIKKLQNDGHEILISDAYKEDVEDKKLLAPEQDVKERSQILISLTPLSQTQHEALTESQHFISLFKPYEPHYDASIIASGKAYFYSLDMIPRTTLAQSMDILSSMASVAGYQAVLLASARLPRYFPMMMTAAGTIRPSKVLIVGAGVAGLQAIATARKLGAKVEAFDVRAAVKEEVESLGAKFVEVEGAKDEAEAGGYAVDQTEEYKQKQKEAIAAAVAGADVVITTAQLRGKPAPLLVTKEMVATMKKGSVIIDMAASSGGNCELSEDKKEVTHYGVTIIGNSELYLDCLQDASDLIANNVYNYIKMFTVAENGQIDNTHEILQQSLINPKTN